MSGSPVGTPPCVVERPGAKRGGTTDRSVASAKLRGLNKRRQQAPAARQDKRESSRCLIGEDQGRHLRTGSGCRGTLRRSGLGTGRRLSSELGVRRDKPAWRRR